MNLLNLLKMPWRAPTDYERMGFGDLSRDGVIAEVGDDLWLFDPLQEQAELHREDGSFVIYKVTMELVAEEPNGN